MSTKRKSYRLERIDYKDGGWCEVETRGGDNHGRTIYYFSNGSKRREIFYQNGRREGAERTWSEDGALQEEQYFHNDVQHGPWFRRDEHGVMQTLNVFRHGVSEGCWNGDGTSHFARFIMPNLEIDQVMHEEQAKTMIARMALPACRVQRGSKIRSDEAMRDSYFGHISILGAQEAWPEFEGRHLSPVLQINCDEIPIEEHPLKDYAYVTLFALPDEPCYRFNQDYVLRVYGPEDELRSVERPEVQLVTKPGKMNFSEIFTKYPNQNDLPAPLKVFLEDRKLEDLYPDDDNGFQTVIGGWPDWMQFSEIWAYPEFLFQVDGLDFDDWFWGDCFMLYFFRDSKTGALSGHAEMY